MKNYLFLFLSVMSSALVNAQNINLPSVSKEGGKSVIESLWNRQSNRSFSTKQLNNQMIGDLMWAAVGVNRTNGKHTNPTARNVQEISLYAFTAEGAYLYNPVEHQLELKVKGDNRNLIAKGQDFVNSAPVVLVIVGDYNKMGNGAHAKEMVAVDAGIVSQNISIFCAGMGLATVPRGTMDQIGIKNLLSLEENQMPIINNPVGFLN